jgi:hypothetical protein
MLRKLFLVTALGSALALPTSALAWRHGYSHGGWGFHGYHGLGGRHHGIGYYHRGWPAYGFGAYGGYAGYYRGGPCWIWDGWQWIWAC